MKTYEDWLEAVKTGHGWMAGGIPEEYKTEELYLAAVPRHQAAIWHVPDHLLTARVKLLHTLCWPGQPLPMRLTLEEEMFFRER